jgi:hypothetical protein
MIPPARRKRYSNAPCPLDASILQARDERIKRLPKSERSRACRNGALHIHGRKYTMDDILRRTLEYTGFKVTHVQNVTDVGHLSSDADAGEDKLEKGASVGNRENACTRNPIEKLPNWAVSFFS